MDKLTLDLWCAYPDDILTEGVAEACAALPSEDERARWQGSGGRRTSYIGNGKEEVVGMFVVFRQVERSFAHCYETGAMRRCTLHGRKNILKRLLNHVGASNISLALRKMLGAGTPPALKNRAASFALRLVECLINLYRSENATKSGAHAVHARLDQSRSIKTSVNAKLENGWSHLRLIRPSSSPLFGLLSIEPTAEPAPRQGHSRAVCLYHFRP
jgi:hypothetical protein